MFGEFICPICGGTTSSYMGHYRKDCLCKKHAGDFKNGQLVQCDKCSEWHYIDKPCKCSESVFTELPTEGFDKCAVCGTETAGYAFCKSCYKQHTNDELLNILNNMKIIGITDNQVSNTRVKTKVDECENASFCVICGQPSQDKPQCKNCYSETKGYIDTLDKNSSIRKLRDYYYNLKERILIMRGIKETKDQCNKLIAIAITQSDINEDDSLIDRVYKDVVYLIKGKQPQPTNQYIVEEQKESDEKKTKINTAQDGHNVDSDMEVRIDDTLYNSYILHCYGKNIDEITEKRKKCDWFIPISNGKGIYIEYWGMEKKDYISDRKEKEELYKLHSIPYIGIEKDDPKKDTQTFRSNLIRDLTKLAVDRFGFMPEWKK